MSEVFPYYDFLVPTRLALLTGAGPETFPEISNEHLRLLKKYMGLNKNESIVEIGCGIGRDAIPLALHFRDNAQYLGIDIIEESIKWLKSNITPRFPNFRFDFVNISDEMHNSDGLLHMRDVSMDVSTNSVDLIYMFSVATHLLQDELEAYLSLFQRWLKPGGRIFMSVFILDEVRAERLVENRHTVYGLNFLHHLGNGVFTQELDRPHAAVAFTEPALTQMIQASGLALAREPIWGSWCPSNHKAEEPGQDIMIIKKPYTA